MPNAAARPRAPRRCRHGALAMLAALLLGGGGAEAQTTWELYTYIPVATQAAARGVGKIAEDVEKATGGEFKIKVHLGGSLQIAATNITQAVADNVVQIADDSFFTGNIPMAGVIRLPMLVRDEAEYAKVAQIVRPYMEAAFAKKGILPLGEYNYPIQVPFSRKKLTQLAEFKGLKLRVTSPEQGELVKRFGGSSVTLGAPEVPAAIDRGVIDGGFTASSGLGWVWRDLVKYNYRLGINYVNAFIVVNKEAFDQLKPAHQTALRKAVDETMPWITRTMADEEADLTKKLADLGVTVTSAKPEEVAQAQTLLESSWEPWAKSHGPEAAEALQKIRAALGR